MLQGERGVLRKEFEKLLDWLTDEPVPDVVNLPNSLLIGLARPLRDVLKCPICCTLQGEDLFLAGLELARPGQEHPPQQRIPGQHPGRLAHARHSRCVAAC